MCVMCDVPSARVNFFIVLLIVTFVWIYVTLMQKVVGSGSHVLRTGECWAHVMHGISRKMVYLFICK